MSGARAPADRVALGLLAMASALTAALYLPGLHGPLLLDDMQVFAPLLDQTPRELLRADVLLSHAGPLGRPLSMASFALDAWWHGTWWPGWKATNVALHLLCAWALYFLLLEIARVGGTPRSSREIALLGAVLWLVHPLHVSTVLYTVQRMTELSALFSLLGLLVYARGRAAYAQGRGGTGCMLSGVLVFTPLAALSKETGLLLPYLVAALELTVFAAAATPRPRWLPAGLVACTLGPLVVGVLYVLGNVDARLLGGYRARDFGPLERLATEARVVLTYLRWIVVPRRMDLGFYHDDIRVTRDVSGDWSTVAAIVVLCAMAGGAWVARRRWPLAAFGVALFLVGLSLESSVFGLDLAFEHRTYLPAAGIALAAATALARLESARLRRALGVACVAVLALADGSRVLVWSDEGALYQAFAAAHPASERARATLAEWYAVNGAYDAALALLARPDDLAAALQRQRVLCLRDGRPEARFDDLVGRVSSAPRISRFSADVIIGLARAAVDGTCALQPAQVSTMLDAMRGLPINRNTRYRLEVHDAMLTRQAGRLDAALTRLREAARAQPDDPFVHYLAAEWLSDAGRPAAARAALERARALRRSERYAAVDRAVEELVEAARQSGPR